MSAEVDIEAKASPIAVASSVATQPVAIRASSKESEGRLGCCSSADHSSFRSRSADGFRASGNETIDFKSSSYSERYCPEDCPCQHCIDDLQTTDKLCSSDAAALEKTMADPSPVTVCDSCLGKDNECSWRNTGVDGLAQRTADKRFSHGGSIDECFWMGESEPDYDNFLNECSLDAVRSVDVKSYHRSSVESDALKVQPLVMRSCSVTTSCVVAGDGRNGNTTSGPASLVRYDEDAEPSVIGINGSGLEHSRKVMRCSSVTNSPVVKSKLGKECSRITERAKVADAEIGRNCSPRKVGKSPIEKKKKGTAWYSVLSPGYKSRSDEFKRFFKDIPRSERLIADYSCALQKDILVHGRLYISQSFLCFYANIFRWATVLKIPFKDVVKLTKERTAKVIPNAIQVITKDERFFFTSFGARDKMFVVLENIYKTSTNDQVLTRREMWLWIHYSYGEELCLTSGDDEDYCPLSAADKIQFQLRLPKLDKPSHITDNLATLDSSKEPEDDFLLGTDCQNLLTVPRLKQVGSLLVDAATPVPETEDQHLLRSLNGLSVVDGQGFPQPPQPIKRTERTPSLPDASTDLNSDDEEATDHCSEHDHFPIQVIDEILNIPTEAVFAHCFTDSPLYRDFVTAKKTFDVVLSSWPDEPDASGTKVRNIAYTLSLNYAIGPKVSPSTERQIMYPETRPGQFYLIDTECINGGIPYGENFYVVNRYCISKISSTRCRLRITSQIKYRKNVWGFIKNFIEKNASAGIIESFNVLADLLRQESNSHATDLATSVRPTCNLARKRVLRRKRASSRTLSKNPSPDVLSLNGASRVSSQTRYSLSTAILAKLQDEWHVRLTFDVLVRIICVVLLLLVVFNAILFCKLWTLESSASTLVHSRVSQYDTSSKREPPKSNQEWLKLLDHQRLLHESEITQWKEILSTSIQLLDQMTHTLADLRSSLDHQPDYKHGKTHDGDVPS